MARSQSSNRHDMESSAAVGADDNSSVTLYDNEGHTLVVNRNDLNVWLGRGFRLTRLDPKASLESLDPLFRAAREALGTLVTDATDNGVIDTNPEASFLAAQIAVQELVNGAANLLQDLQQNYPVSQSGDTVTFVEHNKETDTDVEHVVDASQADLYRKNRNWSEVK